VIHRGKTFQNIAWLVVERVLRVGATAVVIAMVARQLGPAQFGALNYALLLLGLAMPFATLCFDAVVVHELVRSPAEAPSILGSTFLLRAGAGLASALVFFGLGATGGLGVNYSLLVPVGVMLVLQACEVPELWFQRQLLAQWTAAARVVALAVGAVLKIELVRHHAGVSAFVWAQAAENGLYAIGLAWNYARTGGHLADWRWNQALAQKLARLAWPLALAGTLVGLYLRLDQLLVQRWLPPVDAGIYLAASRVIDMATMAAGVVGASLFPNLAAAYGSDEKGFQARLRSVFDLLSGLGFPAANMHSKSWDVFAAAGAPHMDFVFTVCDNAAGEACPVWPGQPMTAHWGVPDPAAVEGNEFDKRAAFREAFTALENRIRIFMSLPFASLDRMALQQRLDAIGRRPPSSAAA